MGEKIRISEYKGFELWDCPIPEGWLVNAYPVQVTCNGEHVNSFANARDAMEVIDDMDADTIAYHMRRPLALANERAAVNAGLLANAQYELDTTRRELALYREFVATVREALGNTVSDSHLPIIQSALNRLNAKTEMLNEVLARESVADAQAGEGQ